jgi:hypothetical protein
MKPRWAISGQSSRHEIKVPIRLLSDGIRLAGAMKASGLTIFRL